MPESGDQDGDIGRIILEKGSGREKGEVHQRDEHSTDGGEHG